MSRRGRTIAVLSILALVVGVVLGALPAQAANQNDGEKQVKPATHVAINYPGYPTRYADPNFTGLPYITGGPYIVAATYRPSAVTGGDPDVLVVFNEDVNFATVASGDFVASGFTFGGVAAGPTANSIRLTSAPTAGAGDLVRLARPQAIAGADGSLSNDVSPIALSTGPVILRAEITIGYADTLASNDEITLTFDAAVQFGAGDSEDNTFWQTPEFNFNASGDNMLEVVGAPTTTMVIRRAAAAPRPFRFLQSGVTKIWMDATRVRWQAVNTENSAQQIVPIRLQQPYLVAAYYNVFNSLGTADDEVTLVFSQPIDPIATDFSAYFVNGYVDMDPDGGGFSVAPLSGNLQSASPLDFSSVLKVTAMGTPPAVPDEVSDQVAVPGLSAPLHSYHASGTTASAVTIFRGPGIIRASYDDRRTSTRTDDQLYIWISEPIQDAQNQIGLSDFTFTTFNTTGLSLTTDVQGAVQRVTVSGFTGTNYPRPGARVRANAGNNMIGALSNDEEMQGGANAPWILIEDESRPYNLQLVEIDALTYDRWNAVDGIDSVFVAWSEAGADDSDQYFLFVTKENPNNIDAAWMNAKLPKAIALGNLRPYTVDGGAAYHRVGVLLDPTEGTPHPGAIVTSMDDVSPDLAEGDQIYLLVAAADFQGNLALRFDQNSLATHLFGAFLVGPLCQPRDFITDASVPADPDSVDWDHDVIHVVGDSTATGLAYFVYGDPGAIPCSADSVVAFRVSNSTASADWLGAVPVNSDGSFYYIDLDETRFLPNETYVFLRTKTDVDYSAPTPIILDRTYPNVLADPATPFADFIFDPWNPYRIYNAGDYVNVRAKIGDYFTDSLGVTHDGLSALIHAWADFTRLDLTAGNISGFGVPADSIPFVSLGNDQVDNDRDWQRYTDVNGNGQWDAGEPVNDDKGLDGLGPGDLGYPGRDTGEADGLPTFGDAYVDENGNGVFDPGETFIDRVRRGGVTSGYAIFDPGEPNLDCQDPDEFGWYEIRNTTAGTLGTVKQGYALANPNPDARLWPQVPVKLWVEDNGIGYNGGDWSPPMPGPTPNYHGSYPQARALPFKDSVNLTQAFVRTLYQVTTHRGPDTDPWDTERSFLAKIDLQPPTVAEITQLFKESGPGTNAGVNEIVPGNPVYHLGRFIDFTTSTYSDDDVVVARAQIKVGPTWRDLNLDPSVATGAANDGNGDGFPGSRFYDEDADSTLARANGLDDDGDGLIDEIGEGIDFSDPEVFAASIDSVANAASPNPVAQTAQNDYRDNDNDAFFLYDSYANGGLVGGAAGIGRITWYNIDESTTNNFDDDNDGQVDEADEAVESIGYGTGANDDNEDGIVNGEAIELPITAFNRLAGDDATYGNFRDAHGFGVATSIWVDASHIFGTRPHAGTDPTAQYPKFYANNTAYTEPVQKAFELLTNSVRTFPSLGYRLAGGTDSTAAKQFNWYAMHANQNLDLELIQKIHGLTADGVATYGLRTLAYDKAGNMNLDWTEPINFTFDLTGPSAAIPGCEGTGTPPPDFADVSATLPGVQIWDSGKHPGKYTLTANAGADAVKVHFYASTDPDLADILATTPVTDPTAPFTTQWPFPPATGMFAMDNYPYNHQQTWYFVAVAEDQFGNITPDVDLCVFEATVLDGTQPTICLAQVGHEGEAFLDTDLRDGAVVPPDSSIDLFVYNQAPPLPGRFDDGDGIDWVGGLDRKTGQAGFDDDADGSIDEDDVDGDGIFTQGVDDAGADGIPGTDDDEWNGSSLAAGGSNLGETDDYITNDIVQVVFQMNPVGDDPDQGWITFATVHGDDSNGQVIDWTQPVKATWNTHGLPTGDYNIRAWGVDWEGNSNELTACIATIGIRSDPLRAYIQPEVCTGALTFDLYAVHHIHDYEIDKVRFEYYYDDDGNLCADDGNSWMLIALDDQATGRGDAVLYPGSTELPGSDAIETLVYKSFGGTDYKFYDADGDGYSRRDPVVNDIGVGNAGVFGTGDVIVIGADAVIPAGATLTAFAADEFWAEAAGEANGLEPTDWIFRENELTGTNGVLNLWQVSWDATGLPEGNYLVRSIAIDENNQQDVISYTCYAPNQQNPEEIELVRIDTVLPNTNITTLTLPDGTSIDVSGVTVPPPYINGNTKWMKITAVGDADVAKMLFEYSLDSGATWNVLDVNNDDDFYANLDGIPGYQTNDYDEVFNDLDGDFVYTPGVDFVRYAGANGVVDTPAGWPLLPLVGEDGGQANLTDGIDDDGDGFTDEPDEAFLPDGVNQDGDQLTDEDFPATVYLAPPDGMNPEDYEAPFFVYLNIADLDLLSDVNALFRATAYDVVCNDVYRADPTPDVLAVIIGENQQPETDVVRAEDLDGVEVDVRPTIMDGSGVATIGADMNTMRVFVTAEDASSVVAVDLFYRLDPSCYDLTIEELQWKSMSAQGWTLPDSVYPYDFDVNTDLIPDGVYQFYPRAYDANQTYNEAPLHPWGFKKFAAAGVDFAYVSVPAPPPAAPSHAAPGDEYTIHGALIDPSQAPTTAVQFYWAHRILDESIDPTQVQPLAPFVSAPLARTVLGTAGDGVVLKKNGVALAYGTDYTIVNGNQVAFTVRPAGTDELLISYNFNSWRQIHTGDSWSPYTVAWSQADGGVPEPLDPIADAYDLIAIAKFDLNGDGVYGTDCDYQEPLASEGNYLILDDQERPELILYGLAFNDFVEPFDYLDWNWPGNPLFRSGDELQGPNYENKLSGIESDVFVVTSDVGGGAVTSVTLDITSSDLAGSPLATTRVDMAKYANVSTIDIPITLYEADFPQWLPGGQPGVPGSFENVVLQISTNGGDTWGRDKQMTRDAATGTWGAAGRFNVGVTDSWTQQYRFIVDLVGDEQHPVIDPRNNGYDDKNGYGNYSALNVPGTPFWYAHIDNAVTLRNNAVHRVLVTATDDSGNVGTNLNTRMPGEDGAQGPIVFIYDNTPPKANAILVTNTDNQPLGTTRVSPQMDYTLWANVSDSPFTDLNVMSLHHVRFEYTPNNGGAWIEIGTDDNPLDGQWHVNWVPINGKTDGYDNDGDGLWDEDDEILSSVTIRVIAVDDGMNSTYSDRQSPAVVLNLTVDAAEPSAALTTPRDGEVFAYTDPIALSGTAQGDYIPAFATNDVAEVRFQAKINRYFFVDQVYNGVGHAGYYDNGIDEVWFDADGDGTFNAGDTNKFAGQDGLPATPSGSAVNYWFDLDPTPQDNSDFPRLTDANGAGDTWNMVWTPAGFSFINADELGGDEYVRLRMLSKDTAGNWDTWADLLGPQETLIILNDNTVTRAYVTHVGTNDQDGVVDPVEIKAIQARNPVMVWGRYFGAAEVTQVNLYLVTGTNPETVQFVGADNNLTDNSFEILWNAETLPEGTYALFATAVDVDQNESDPAQATRVRVRIDRTAPVVNYTPVGSYNGFAPFANYVDDGIVNHTSQAILPDALTGDVNFVVTTPDADVESIVLQWRWAIDPVGLWRPAAELFQGTVLADGMFDYEPNLDFTHDGTTHHVWWLHIENFAEQLLKTGRMEFRGLATDEAKNTNALQTTWAQYTADNLPPTGYDWNDDSVTNQIEVGTTVNFEIALQDALMQDDTRTDVVQAVLQYRVVGTPTWLTWGAVVPEGVQIDTGNAMWIARFAWTAPNFVVHDTTFEYRVLMVDSAGNSDVWSRSGYTITVEDNAPPDRTKIVDVVAQVFSAHDDAGKGGPPPQMWDDNEDVWKDLNGNGTFQLGSDWLISEGDDLQPPFTPTADDPAGEPVGDPCATFPRNVGESYLNDARVRNTVKVSRTVTIVGRTQSDDDGIGQLDTGIQTVTFVLQPVDANGNPVGNWYTLGVDEYAPGFPLFYWHYVWDTTIYPNGTYKLGCWAMDEEGNVEDQTSLDWTNAIIVIDNEAPSAQMDANAATETVEKTATVERNRPFTLFARTLKPGTSTLENSEDDAVEFWYKRARDLNMADSWGVVPVQAQADPNMPEDGNPDYTRPYSFDVQMGLLPDPTYPYGQDVPVVPLAVGETYDFCVAVQDEVCNETSVIESYADSLVAGVGTRYIRLLIQDTIAPHLEFTRIELNGECHDDNDNPTKVHARGFEYIEARLLTGDLDIDHAEFVYRLKGTQTWNLIDAVLTHTDGKRTWTLGSWDLRTLQHGAWYEVAVVGVDDVGNVDQNPDILEVYVDYEAPPSVMISPLQDAPWCGGILDLIVQVDRGAENQHDDVCDVVWWWKHSQEADQIPENPQDWAADGWSTYGVAASDELYDDATNRYSNTLDLTAEVDEAPVFPTGLYDLRTVVVDDAGNTTILDVTKAVVDQEPPDYVAISNIKWNGDDTTQDPNDDGQYTDVTAGSMVQIFGTASDDEENLPNEVDPQNGRFYETMIAMMQFQVAYDLNADGNVDDGTDWHDLGTVHLDPPTLGDMSAQTAFVYWNTTGLPEGQYLLRVLAVDQCGNGRWSAPANVRILDWTPPIARIVAWDADQQPHGNPAPSFVTIYALAESDTTDADPEQPGWQPTYDVQVQYNIREAGETVPTGPWVNLGIALPADTGDEFTTEHLWYATVDPALFGSNVTSVWLRALVKDESGNRYGDNPEDIIPTVAVNLVRQRDRTDTPDVVDGTITLEQVRSAELQGGFQMIESVGWMVESPTHLVVTLDMTVQDQTPRVILLSEPYEPSRYPSWDNPRNYSPGVRRNGQLVGLTRSIDDPTVWRGEIFLEDPADCTHYGLWVTALDGTAGTAQWIDLDNVFMREFRVTTALGTNGTVDTPGIEENPGVQVMVPSGGWPESPACLLTSPTYPPLMSTDQARYLNPIDLTAYHLEMLSGSAAFRRGYEPLVKIHYSDEMAAAALAGTESSEADLTVRRWNPAVENRDGTTGAWVGTGISHIKVYPDENYLAFRVRDLLGVGAGGGGATDLAFSLDGSGSVSSADFTLQLEGVAAALENAAIIPRDGSVSVCVVQFGNGAATEVPLTRITSAAVATNLANQVRAIAQSGDGTPMDEGINEAVTALGGGTSGASQVIVLSTDGFPNDAQAALQAADAAVAAGVEDLYCLGIGSGADMTFLATLVRGNGTATAVATFNDFAQAVSTMVSDIVVGSQSGGGNVFQLFAPKRNAPVVLSNMWPNSPYVTDWWTDADPIIVVYLRDPGGQVIDPYEAELLLDGEYWATWLDGDGNAEFIRGNGKARLRYANQDRTIMELVYHHSTFPRDWLTDGRHLLTVRYKADNGTDQWMESNFTFNVDRKSPYIEFDGGFVSNPRLINVKGYMNPNNTRLVAKMYDGGTGILFKHDRPWFYADFDCDGILNPNERQFDPVPAPLEDWLEPGYEGQPLHCWIQADWSLKYDVWRVDPPCLEPCYEDDQRDIDEIEERHLLHQGTANELEPWITPKLEDYNPATDTLKVPVAVLGGGSVKDNDVIEITWYSDKSIEENSDGPGWGCHVDTLWVGDIEYHIWAPGCSYDANSQEMHIYNQGVTDWAANSGSKYVEQRFIVDTSAPVCTIVSPAATIEPGGDMVIEVTIADGGVGLNPATVSVTVVDPEGNVLTPTPQPSAVGRYLGKVSGPLKRGEYQVKVSSSDYLGNVCNSVKTVKVEAAVLAIAEAKVTPNPFNPNDLSQGPATFNLNLTKSSYVTVKVYDFAGLEVATLKSSEWMSPGDVVKWAGQAGDGTNLANGAYIVRITANDGVRTAEQNLKVVIWRQ